MFFPATQLRSGHTIKHDNELYSVMEVMHVTPGKGRGIVQSKLRNLRTGLQTEKRFRSEDKIERVTLEQNEMEFLYEDGGQYHFMNTETYEQVALVQADLGNNTGYLTPNVKVQVELYEDKPVGIKLPKTVDLKVVDVPPPLKTATVTQVLKPATMETGLVVQVPNFIENHEILRIDTITGEYMSRAK